MSGVKPCPFCGDVEGRTHSDANGYNWSRRFWVTCGCLAHGPEAPTEAEAIAAWNRSARADWKEAANALTDALADERDRTILLIKLLIHARTYVADSLEAHEHSDGRALLTDIDGLFAQQEHFPPCHNCGQDTVTRGPWGFADCIACNPPPGAS